MPRDGWSAAQAKLFSKMMKVLTQDRLARLALEGQPNEPVLRRIAVDRAAKRARGVLAAPPCVWDRNLVQWLQGLLTARLPRPYLAAWLDILQTLRAHLPGLVDRLLAAPTGGFQLDSRARAVSREGLSLLLRRPWDPAATGLTRRRLARLPGNPVLVVAPPGPADPKLVSRRMRLWNNQLGCLGKVIVINMPPPRGEAGNRTPVGNYLYQVKSLPLFNLTLTSLIRWCRPLLRKCARSSLPPTLVQLCCLAGELVRPLLRMSLAWRGSLDWWALDIFFRLRFCLRFLKGVPWIPHFHIGWIERTSWRSSP